MKPFNVRGKGRHYKSPTTGQNLPSVTNILDCYPKQHALVHWAANRQKAFDVQAAFELYVSGRQFEDGKAYMKALDEYIGKQRAHVKELEKAGDLGTQIHKAIESDMKEILGIDFQRHPELEGPALWAYMAFQDWWDECDIAPLASELFVHSDELGYAGTVDLAAEVVITEPLLRRVAPKYRTAELMSHMGQRVNCIVDMKSSKGIYDDMFLQLAAYITAFREHSRQLIGTSYIDIAGGGPDLWGMIVRLPKTEDDPEFEVRLLMPRHRQQKLDTFLAVKKIWEDKHNAWY